MALDDGTDVDEARRRGQAEARSRGSRRAEVRGREREQRKAKRAAAGQRPRVEDATDTGEVLDATYEEGRAAGQRERPAAPSSGRRGITLPPSEGVPGAVTAPMVVQTMLVTADEWVTERRFPVPSRLLIVFGFFGALGLAKGAAAKPAAVLGWGIVAASFYASVAPSGQPSGLRALVAIGRFVSGDIGTGGTIDGGNPGGASQNTAGLPGSNIAGPGPIQRPNPTRPGQVG